MVQVDIGGFSFGRESSKIHRKKFTDATVRTNTGDTNWADSGTSFTLTTSGNAMILGMRVKAEVKNSSVAKNGFLNLKLTGSTITTQYIRLSKVIDAATDIWATTSDTTEFQLFSVLGSTYIACGAGCNVPIELPDVTTTITVRIKTDDGTETVSIQNVELDVIYAENWVED